MLRNGIELDLSNFYHVLVNAKANTLRIGGMVCFRDVFGPLGQARKELCVSLATNNEHRLPMQERAIGSEPCVGIVGAALGVVSRYNSLHGTLLEPLLSVKMITTDGKITIVSNSENSDLF